MNRVRRQRPSCNACRVGGGHFFSVLPGGITRQHPGTLGGLDEFDALEEDDPE